MNVMPARLSLRIPTVAALLLACAGPARAETPDAPLPERPPETPAPLPGEDAGAWVHAGWYVGTEGSAGRGTTRLTVRGAAGSLADLRCPAEPGAEPDDRPAVVEPPGTRAVGAVLGPSDTRAVGAPCLRLDEGSAPVAALEAVALPVTVTLEGPATLALSVRDRRGARWEGPVEVPAGLHVTSEVLPRYQHRGYLGSVVNDTAACKPRRLRQKLRLDVLSGRAPAAPHVVLEPGKSAPGIRLPAGSYTLLVSEPGPRRTWREREAIPFEVAAPDWRAVVPCPATP